MDEKLLAAEGRLSTGISNYNSICLIQSGVAQPFMMNYKAQLKAPQVLQQDSGHINHENGIRHNVYRFGDVL